MYLTQSELDILFNSLYEREVNNLREENKTLKSLIDEVDQGLKKIKFYGK